MLGDGRREKSTKLFFIEIKAYRSVQATKEPETILIAAYGVKDLSPAAEAAPELPLLRHRFRNSRPAFTMGVLSQKGGPIELVIAPDYKKHWPKWIDTSCFATDKLFLMKTVFHPGQFLCGQADPEAVGTKMKGVKRRLTLETGESAGSSTSSSRRPRAATPMADSPERRRRDSPSPIRRGGEEEEGRGSIIQIHICGIIRCTAAAGGERARPEGQGGRVRQREGQEGQVCEEERRGVPSQEGTGKEEEGTQDVHQQQRQQQQQ
jgi:hypothetical protein